MISYPESGYWHEKFYDNKFIRVERNTTDFYDRHYEIVEASINRLAANIFEIVTTSEY